MRKAYKYKNSRWSQNTAAEWGAGVCTSSPHLPAPAPLRFLEKCGAFWWVCTSPASLALWLEAAQQCFFFFFLGRALNTAQLLYSAIALINW